ncbi:MAG: hypothetical protein AB199_01110 [Parcubacteria bacterium C7867-004]|nr:MAG: hypothetical protein AB199_01110 [Parcubacteria bacterium C7867-004]
MWMHPGIIAAAETLTATTGDPIAFTVRSNALIDTTINGEGFMVDVTFKGLSTGQTADATKISGTITRAGYTNTGAATTYTLPFVGTLAARRAGPSYASFIQTTSGSDVVISYILDRSIFSTDTVTSVTIASGAYTGSRASNSALLVITNSSTYAPLRPHCQFITPPHLLVTGGTTAPIEIAAFHAFAQGGSEVACVKVRARDAVSGGNVGAWTTVNTMSASTILTYSGLTSCIYRADVDVSAINAGDCYIEYVAYPWESSRVFDSNNALGGGADGTALDSATTGLSSTAALRPLDHNPAAVLHFYNDKTTAYAGAYANVDPSAGNDTTGTVYATQDAADSGNLPFLTINAAYGAVKTYNNATKAGTRHNDAGGAVISLKNGTYYMFGGTTNATQNVGSVWTYIRKHPSATASSVILNSVQTGVLVPNAQRVIGRRTWLEDVSMTGATVGISNSNTYLYGNDFGRLTEGVFNRVGITSVSGVAATSPSWHYAFHLLWLYNCDLGQSVTTSGGGVASGAQGVVLGGSRLSLNFASGLHWAMGNLGADAGIGDAPRLGNANFVTRYAADIDAWIGAFNYIKVTNASGSGAVYAANLLSPAASNGTSAPTNGYVWVGNQLEMSDNLSATAKCMQLAADGSAVSCPNMVMHANSHVGERTNVLYNEITGAPAYPKRIVMRYNLYTNFNCKRDTNNAGGSTHEAARTGVYAHGYHVDGAGNFAQSTANTLVPGPLSWYGERWAGVNGGVSSSLTYGFVDDRSLTGTSGSGGGDYRVQSGSSALGLVPAGQQPLSHYLYGAVRDNSVAGPAGCREPA